MLTLKSTALGLTTLIALGLAVVPSAHAQIATPITTTGYKSDVIVDAAPESYANTQAFDVYNQWGFYTANDTAAGATFLTDALPANGAFTATSGNKFQFAPYNGNNALLISNTTLAGGTIPAKNGTGPAYSFSNTGTLTLTSPGKYSSIGILNADAYGPSVLSVTFNYSDATTTVRSLSVLDWFNGGATSAINNRRIDVGNNTTGGAGAGTPDTTGGGNGESHFYENYFTVDPTKTLTGITFVDTADQTTSGNGINHAVAGIFGINGVAAAPEPGETAALVLGGLGLLGLIARKRRVAA